MNLVDDFNNILTKYEASKINAREVITSNGKYPTEIDYLKDHLTKEILENLKKLIETLNLIRKEYSKPMTVSCGFRNIEHNIKVNGAKNSLHCSCRACDILDTKGELDTWLVNHEEFLKNNGIFCEHPFYTKNWSHIQFEAPKSKNTFFTPYTGRPKPADKDDKFAFMIQ